MAGARGKTIAFPKTIRQMLACMAWEVPLRSVILNEGLEALEETFWRTKIKKMTLPRTLKNVDYNAFSDCENLKVIYVENGCEASLCDTGVMYPTKVGPPLETMLGSRRVWKFRGIRRVIIPDGIEKIGNHWFWGSNV